LALQAAAAVIAALALKNISRLRREKEEVPEASTEGDKGPDKELGMADFIPGYHPPAAPGGEMKGPTAGGLGMNRGKFIGVPAVGETLPSPRQMNRK
jgi:hypothetical protein